MGFRSTLTSESLGLEGGWPLWFIEKYEDTLVLQDFDSVLGARCEAKLYEVWLDLTVDIQRALVERGHLIDNHPFVLVFLHECGGISRCEIHVDKILWTEPETWRAVEEHTHNYCYGCSDARRAEAVDE